MDQQSTYELPTLPEDAIEGQYSEASEEEGPHSTDPKSYEENARSIIKTKKKRKEREQKKNLKPLKLFQVNPHCQGITQNTPRIVFVIAPTKPSLLQHKISRQERPVVKIKEKYNKLNVYGEEVEKFIRKVEQIAQIEGERDEDLAMQMEFWTKEQRISD
ncbi:hypothetical protein O181_124168 [Austropuccinia psidii MF-1]|uniref:Uncharacterized protein n=1 Tax=Austropuccinia psidii MF-1 TaxID=1389203 RepID=A0A9Q3KN54_9BASI|nr:hypothetical protein [Austropuccinia psidii MF-1]